MNRSSLVVLTLLFAAASCSGGDGPTDPGNGGNNGGGGGGGSGGGGGTPSTVDTVIVNGVSFSPSSLTVASGRTVVFMKEDAGVLHTVTPTGHSAWARVSSTGSGEILRVAINAAGSYPYLCEAHAGMTGTIVVQ